jgi:hypothetical protein
MYNRETDNIRKSPQLPTRSLDENSTTALDESRAQTTNRYTPADENLSRRLLRILGIWFVDAANPTRPGYPSQHLWIAAEGRRFVEFQHKKRLNIGKRLVAVLFSLISLAPAGYITASVTEGRSN